MEPMGGGKVVRVAAIDGKGHTIKDSNKRAKSL